MKRFIEFRQLKFTWVNKWVIGITGMLYTNYKFSRVYRPISHKWSSYKEHKGDALAPRAEEGRSNLRKATVSRKQAIDPWISEWGNPLSVMTEYCQLNK